MTRIRRVESVREQEKLVDEFMTKGYKVKQRGQYSARVKKKDWGSIHVHGFVFLFAFLAGAVLSDATGLSSGSVWVVVILANLAYASYCWVTAEEIIIKVDGEGNAE